MLVISSFLWVIILQLDKVYFSIAYNQEYFIKYSLFSNYALAFLLLVQQCTQFMERIYMVKA